MFPSCLSFVISLVRPLSSWDRSGRMAKEKLAACHHRADSGVETVKNVRRHSLDRLHASMIKQKKKHSQ